ncbi:hypothetical protein FisN_26Hh132 [Fistulifera solaris]|uniref:Tetratricopeptide repeat protein n=1 Tax=Fistulifera solaris TaxID=1519565 RepID=A0A1Z5JXT9_FISSO|nr:hypothetical protein FisN_26Hh132 [Fistulifera solaris]|eukprot:GAX18830.1 hypothetical protein FisN_26Hh132 [Fistulifera solaris]
MKILRFLGLLLGILHPFVVYGSSADDTQQPPLLSKQDQTEHYTELALQYQQQAALPQAVQAFQKAIELSTEQEDRLAALYFQLGETYYMMLQQQEGSEPTYEQAMFEAWEQSKQLYRAALQDNDDPWISIGYAMVCIQQGVYWTEKGDPLQGYELLHEGLVQYLEPSLSKLESSHEEYQIVQQQRVTAWHNVATAATLLGQFDVALQALQPVLTYYEAEGKDEEEMSYYYAQALYSQADLYLQLGQYDSAKQSYHQAMDFYQRQDLVDAALLQQQALPVVGDEWRESIQMYQDALHEYNELLTESSDDPTASSAAYEMDLGYVGDLHATLGSLYLSTNELVLAEMHLRQAIRSYTTSDDRRYLADVHFNLAQLLFQQGEYSESAEQRALACDLYKETVGEGVNPMTADIEDEELLMEESMRMETRWLPSQRTATTVKTHVRDTEKVITMDAEELSQRKNNYTHADDEL